jgi:hypothetical protein
MTARLHVALVIAASVLGACAAATPTPTPTPTPAPTPTPRDGGYTPVPTRSPAVGEVAITGRVVFANGAAAANACVILTSGQSCAATTDAQGNFQTTFTSAFTGQVDVLVFFQGKLGNPPGTRIAITQGQVTPVAMGLIAIN